MFSQDTQSSAGRIGLRHLLARRGSRVLRLVVFFGQGRIIESILVCGRMRRLGLHGCVEVGCRDKEGELGGRVGLAGRQLVDIHRGVILVLALRCPDQDEASLDVHTRITSAERAGEVSSKGLAGHPLLLGFLVVVGVVIADPLVDVESAV